MLVGVVQLTSKANKKKNLSVASTLMLRAVHQGAELVALPEYFSFIGPGAEMAREAEKADSGPAHDLVKAFAKKQGVYVLAGSIPIHSGDKEDHRLLNRSFLFGPDGKEIGHYDKMHLFDNAMTGYKESDTFRPGDKLGLGDTPFGKVGMSICYDLRFSELYRALTFAGARVIFVPAQFTMYTGKDHWLTLLRTRAIENQVFIVAPAQIGNHSETKVSFGKSCIIDPWGNIIALAPDCETVVVADIDFKFQSKIRKELPVLKHCRKDVFKL